MLYIAHHYIASYLVQTYNFTYIAITIHVVQICDYTFTFQLVTLVIATIHSTETMQYYTVI